MLSLESISDNIHKVFMLGQNDPLVDQIDQEIADAATVEITRWKKSTKDAEKVAEKKPIPAQGQDGVLTSTDHDDGDDTTSLGGFAQKNNYCHQVKQKIVEGFRAQGRSV
jgi:hypothetical protein